MLKKSPPPKILAGAAAAGAGVGVFAEQAAAVCTEGIHQATVWLNFVPGITCYNLCPPHLCCLGFGSFSLPRTKGMTFIRAVYLYLCYFMALPHTYPLCILQYAAPGQLAGHLGGAPVPPDMRLSRVDTFFGASPWDAVRRQELIFRKTTNSL